MRPTDETDSPAGGDASAGGGRDADTPSGPESERVRREAEALRRNLARRKAQQRARQAPDET